MLSRPAAARLAALALAAALHALHALSAPGAAAQTPAPDTTRATPPSSPAAMDHAGMDHAGMHHGAPAADPAAWRMPPMDAAMPMLPGTVGLTPPATPFLPGMGIDPASVPAAAFRRIEQLADGDTLLLEAALVRRTINGRTFVMYGFNGQYPGPLIRAPQDATIVVDFRNRTGLPTAVHWHGVRLENRFDGVPHVTQEPVEPGGRFVYQVHFRDAGLYWYHPHHREDITQDLGLYGNMMVSSPDPDYYNPVNREEVVMLDDLLIDDAGIFPYGRETATHALMGRFGNLMLVNGEPEYRLKVQRGEVVRYFLTNVSNTRIFNLSFGGAPIKLVGSDVGRFEREEWVESVVIAPAERYIVEVRFDQPGTHALVNRVQAVDHYRGVFYAHVDTLGTVQVDSRATEQSHRATFERLREHPAVIAEMDRYREHFGRAPDHELEFDVRIGALPLPVLQMIAADTSYFPPVEWNDVMPGMNYLSTGRDVTWILRDRQTGRENMDIQWRFRVGDVVRLRVTNPPGSQHPMQHPVHVHGQRFLVLSRDGVPADNLVWKDTAVVPLGSTVELLIEMSNPGDWMLHCHISEHLETGMKMVFRVDP